jgi:predicted O-methyltransferase YrrM
MATVPEQSGAPPAARAVTADEMADRVLGSALGMVETMSIYVGDRLGFYRALADGGALAPGELARRTGTHERYAREWLEQQAVCGLLDAHEEAAGRRFSMPDAAREVLTDPDSTAYLAPLARMFMASAGQVPALLEAYRTGGGVGWDRLGADARESQADMNRPWFEHQLADALAGVRELDETLRAADVRIADLGCGGGWSSIALARAYPGATVHGFDVDAPSVAMATRNAAEAGMSDRVQVHVADAGSLSDEDQYDVAFAFECVHDLPEPVAFLRAARRIVRPGGAVVVMDEAVQPVFTAPGDELERLMYGCSLFICLPDGMAHQPSAATGTVMRDGTLRAYAAEAGFSDVEILPIEEFGFWRFYRLA